MLRVGLFVYDHLGGRKILPASRSLDLRESPAGEPLSANRAAAFEYSDCWADDSRLVVLNAIDAAERGATVLTRTAVISAERNENFWTVTTQDANGGMRTVRARAIVNATGPWVAAVSGSIGMESTSRPVRLVRGSHIVTRRLFDGQHAYLFQGEDSRMVFAIPYERDFTLIGTTETEHGTMQGDVTISAQEQAYLLDFINRYLRRSVCPEDIVWTYSGVRPLLDEAGKKSSEVSREYVLDLDVGNCLAPALTVYGGKLTTYRTLAERALSKLQEVLGGRRNAWTANSHLPGGNIENADFDGFERDMQKRYSWLEAGELHRLLRAYGTRVEAVIGRASRPSDLGMDFGHGLHAAEVDYLRQHEFVATADDVLWRRSKLGIRFDDDQVESLTRWMCGDASRAIRRQLGC